jgi:hypothetical protein
LGFPLGVGFSFGDKIPFCALEWVMKKKEKELGLLLVQLTCLHAQGGLLVWRREAVTGSGLAGLSRGRRCRVNSGLTHPRSGSGEWVGRQGGLGWLDLEVGPLGVGASWVLA